MLALVCLCMQNSVLVLSMRYTRSVLEERYLSSSVVVMMEALKFIFSTAMCTKDGCQQLTNSTPATQLQRAHTPPLSCPVSLLSADSAAANFSDILGQPPLPSALITGCTAVAQLLT